MPSDTKTITPATHERGDTVYTEGGHAWDYIATLGDGAIVLRAIIDTDDEEFRYARSTMIVDKVWAKPPRQLVDAEVAATLAMRETLGQEVRDLQDEKAALERDIPARIEALAELDGAVNRIEDFMHDRITHVVRTSHGRTKILTLGLEVYRQSRAVETADAYGVPVDARVRAHVMAYRRLQLAKSVDDKTAGLARAQAALDEHDGAEVRP